jgi:hypothetical protein
MPDGKGTQPLSLVGGDDEDVLPLLGGEVRGDKRTAGLGRLGDQHIEREAADEPVARGEVASISLGARSELGDEGRISMMLYDARGAAGWSRAEAAFGRSGGRDWRRVAC